jgi:hypothetical protein
MQRMEEFQSAQNSKNGIIEKVSQTKIMMITDPERCNEITP